MDVLSLAHPTSLPHLPLYRDAESIEHYSVQHYAALGMSQQTFLENFISYFRHVVYAGRTEVVFPGPPAMTVQGISYVSRAVVLDRIGTLGVMYRDGDQYAKASLSLSLSFNIFTAPSINITHVTLPAALAALSLLHKRPTVDEMVHFSANTISTSPEGCRRLIAKTLSFFVNNNFITLWLSHPISGASVVTPTVPQGYSSTIGTNQHVPSTNSERDHVLKQRAVYAGVSIDEKVSASEHLDQVIEHEQASLLRRLNFTETDIAADALRLRKWRENAKDSGVRRGGAENFVVSSLKDGGQPVVESQDLFALSEEDFLICDLPGVSLGDMCQYRPKKSTAGSVDLPLHFFFITVATSPNFSLPPFLPH